MSKPKDQGTRAETRIVNLHQALGIKAKRLPEGGVYDEGDIEIDHPLFRIVGEVRDREKMNAAGALEIAEIKSGTYRTALFWTQRVPRPGILRRKARRCVVIPEAFWFEIVSILAGRSHG